MYQGEKFSQKGENISKQMFLFELTKHHLGECQLV